jgi:hypothetical protein
VKRLGKKALRKLRQAQTRATTKYSVSGRLKKRRPITLVKLDKEAYDQYAEGKKNDSSY